MIPILKKKVNECDCDFRYDQCIIQSNLNSMRISSITEMKQATLKDFLKVAKINYIDQRL